MITNPGVAQKGEVSSGDAAIWDANNVIKDGGGAPGTVTSITAADGTITVTPSPLTGAGTIGVSTNGVANANLTQIAAQRLKGNAGFATANVSDLTPAQSATLISLPGYINGLTLSAAGSTGTFGITVGIATDSTNVAAMSLASAYTKTTAAWVLGTGNGALDTGAIANTTWYHIFLIQRVDTGVTDILFSLSPTSPTMPTNYTLFRRIGSMKTDGSAQWVAFSQFGDEFLWLTSVHDMIGVATTVQTGTLQTITVPTGITVTADFRGQALGISIVVLFTSPVENDQTVGSGMASLLAETIGQDGWFKYRTNTSAQMRWRSNTTGGTIDLWTRGWSDMRGKS